MLWCRLVRLRFLTRVGERANADHIRKFIANPQTEKPGTAMPELAALKADPSLVDAITAFSKLRVRHGEQPEWVLMLFGAVSSYFTKSVARRVMPISEVTR